MGRPVTKSELLSAAAENYEEMNKMISSMTEKELSTPFDFPGKMDKGQECQGHSGTLI